MKYLIILFACVFCLAASCNKEHLPEYYFKCKVNGQEYMPDNCANCTTADLIGDTTFIFGGNKGIEAIAIGVKDLNGISVKVFLLNHLNLQNKGGGAIYKNTTSTIDQFKTDSIRTGQFNITTIDKTNKIIAGTFFFEAFNAVQNKTVNISEGKFRLQYKIY
jgi:hypothetical protein